MTNTGAARIKFTPALRKLLQKIADGGKASAHQGPSVISLAALGFVTRAHWEGDTLVPTAITDAGRAALQK